MWQYRKPIQKPHPPVILGSASRESLQRVVDYCDGWVPIGLALRDLPAAIRELHATAEAAGRDPRSIELSLFWAPGDADALGHFRSLGISRGIPAVPPLARAPVPRMLDDSAPLGPGVAGCPDGGGRCSPPPCRNPRTGSAPRGPVRR